MPTCHSCPYEGHIVDITDTLLVHTFVSALPFLVCATGSDVGCLQVISKRLYCHLCHIQLKTIWKNVSY